MIEPWQNTRAASRASAGSAGSLLPGQETWNNGVSSYLFGTNDTEEWDADNVQTDPHGIIQPALKNGHLTLMRTFIFHYSLVDGHRTSIGLTPQSQLNPTNPHEYDQPPPPPGINTGSAYEVEQRVATAEKSGMTCLAVLPSIRTDPTDNVDPNPDHQRIIDPDTGQLETDFDFARKVVAYLGNRCNLYEIGNEPDLDGYTRSNAVVPHMDVQTYVARWTEFVRELRKINPNARFIGPVTYNDQGNDCIYAPPFPFPTSQPGDCYMRNFMHGVQGTDVEPDAVSFHWYPCDGGTPTTCLPKAATYKTVALEVKGWVNEIFGRNIPVGITEWNMDPGSNLVLGNDAAFMDQFTRDAIGSMIQAHLDFANQFDAQSFSGYGALDMFDLGKGDQPKAQFLALQDIIRVYRPSPLILAPTSLTFGEQLIGTTSTPQTVTLTNSDRTALTLVDITVGGDFARTTDCPIGPNMQLGPGATCTVSVSFTPTAVGPRGGTLTITSDAAGSQHTVALSGLGTSAPSPPPPAPPPPLASPPTPAYTLALSATGGGSASGGGSYPAGGVATLTATTDAGSVFIGWTVDGTFAGWASPLTLTMKRDRTVVATFAARPSFPDVPPSHPAYEAISELAARGIVQGYQDGHLGLADTTLRAQMAALIARALGWDAEDHGNPFPDRGSVDVDLWRNVGTLAFYNVARGYQDGKYRPTNPVLQAQVISFVTRAMVAKGYWQQETVDDPTLYPNITVASGHRWDVLTYYRNAGAIPGTAPAASWAAWNQPAARGWFALAEWQALNSYWGANRAD